MVCRSLIGPPVRESIFLGFGPQNLKEWAVPRLCQLRRLDVAAAATDYQIESDDFLMAIKPGRSGLALLTSSVFSAIPSPN